MIECENKKLNIAMITELEKNSRWVRCRVPA